MATTSTSTTQEYTILLVGETGIGKSTFINALANYINFPSLDDALAAEAIHSLIPSRFTITDDDFNSKEIIFGKDENESFIPGASSTQDSRSYKLIIDDNVTIRLIDTPGVGDTRGINKDEENFANLLRYISEFKYLNGICILLKPNESRVNVLFEYCIKQLLSCLEKSACDNIIFLFTNARSTFYRPGDTVIPLKKVLKDIKDTPPYVSIPFERANTFCVDNEAFRYLIAKRNGYSFTDDEHRNFSLSWTTSVGECKKLLKYVTKLEKHKVQDTVSLNEARRLIERLREPLALISQNIVQNLARINGNLTILSDKTKTVADLQEMLKLEYIGLKVEELNHPMTVCASPGCIKPSKITNSSKLNYKRPCHDHCYLTNVGEEYLGHPALKRCIAMTSKNGKTVCKHNFCGHGFETHMHVYYKVKEFLYTVIDENIDKTLKSEQAEVKTIKQKVAELKISKKAWEDEKDIIQKYVAKFAHFLQFKSILPYNDTYERYIEYLINTQEKAGSGANRELIGQYQTLMKNYKQEKDMLETALKEAKRTSESVQSIVSAADVMDMIKDLYNLKHTGKTIREIYEAKDSLHANAAVRAREKNVKIATSTYAPIKNTFAWFIGSLLNTGEVKPTKSPKTLSSAASTKPPATGEPETKPVDQNQKAVGSGTTNSVRHSDAE